METFKPKHHGVHKNKPKGQHDRNRKILDLIVPDKNVLAMCLTCRASFGRYPEYLSLLLRIQRHQVRKHYFSYLVIPIVTLVSICVCGHQNVQHQPECLWLSGYGACDCKAFVLKERIKE